MKLQDAYKCASASCAVVPGFVTITTNLGTPPGISNILYGGLADAVGAFTFLLLYLNRKSIQQWSERKVNKITISMFILSIVLLLSYFTIFNTQVIYNEKYDTKLFFP